MDRSETLSRRAFLGISAGIFAIGLLAACTPTAPATKDSPPSGPKPTTAPAEPAAKSPALAPATSAPATDAQPAPTPAAAKPAEAKPAAQPTAAQAAPAAAKPAEPKLGANLIGKLEGPIVVTDAAQMPKAFKEAPMLAELVKAGKLPPVVERIGQDPIVTKPVHEIGKYGGTWRRAFTGPADYFNAVRSVAGSDKLIDLDYTGDKPVPGLAKSWEFSDGGRTLTLQLRRGMRWSDGAPFTADDVMFWFEDVYSNQNLVPVPTFFMSINGKPGTIVKVDAHTIQYRFPDPYFLLPNVLSGSNPMASHANYGRTNLGGYAPAHYLTQLHPKYSSQDQVDKLAKDAGFDNWAVYFANRNTWGINLDLPTMSPWKTTVPANTPVWTFERNPYSIWVDTEGNQLPYIDKVTFTLAENLEVLNLRAIAGEIDYQSRHISLAKLPALLENQQRGGYRVYLDPSTYGADCCLEYNHSYEEDPENAKWLSTANFRRALSLGINRDQLNEAFWLGLGTPGSGIPDKDNPYFPGEEYRSMWSTHDPKRANELLDKIGLTQKDAEGYRLRTDGKGRLRVELDVWSGLFMPYAEIGEMIREHWKAIGVDLNVKEVERGFGMTRRRANQHQIFAISNDGSDHPFTFPTHLFPNEPGTSLGHLYGVWFSSSGAQGKEPPARMKELMEIYRRGVGVPEEEQIKAGKEMWKIVVDEQYVTGTVGLSPAANGVRVAKVNMGNVPSRQANATDVNSPLGSRPQTFYWKS
jgi:peptide/nickel transport system substrate-binding protein